MTDPLIPFDEGRIQRGNGNGGHATPKPDFIPRGQYPRSITFPDPDPSRRPTNAYTGEPVQPKQEPEPEPEPEPQPRRRFASLNGYVSNGEEILIAIDTDGVAWTSTAGFQWVRVVDLPND
jgi:hypothetical protein